MILQALADGQCHSGAMLASDAGVTRAAIWKQIEALRAAGVPIEAQGRQGYQLPWPIELLDHAAIEAGLAASGPARPGPVDVHWELDSTSSELQRRGLAIEDLSFVLAESQTAGRGRRGRAWLSPPGLNIYLSCFKRFERGFGGLAGLSLAIGVMVVKTLEQLGMPGAGLKWPNDILSAQGKLAGILVELAGEYQGPCAAVIGVGLNVRLPAAVQAQAGQAVSDLASLGGGHPPSRNRIAACLIGQLSTGLRQFESAGLAAFIDDYRRLDRLYQQPLRVDFGTRDLHGIGAGIDADGALLLTTADGIERIHSADVSVRPT